MTLNDFSGRTLVGICHIFCQSRYNYHQLDMSMTASTLVALFLLRLNRILRKYQSLENQTWPTSNPTRIVQWYETLVCMFRIHGVTL